MGYKRKPLKNSNVARHVKLAVNHNQGTNNQLNCEMDNGAYDELMGQLEKILSPTLINRREKRLNICA
jgi:hypothetical protein